MQFFFHSIHAVHVIPVPMDTRPRVTHMLQLITTLCGCRIGALQPGPKTAEVCVASTLDIRLSRDTVL